VLVGAVVDDQIHDQLHAPGVHAGQQLVERRQVPEHRVDVGVVADVVPVVVLRRRVDRRQPQHIHAQAGEVVEVGDDATQVAHAVAVGVGEASGIDLVHHGALPPKIRHGSSVTRGRGPKPGKPARAARHGHILTGWYRPLREISR
jgi:hypothetical protein